LATLRSLEVLSPGLLTTIQDLGRFGYGRYGVAPSGALDCFSLRIANLLVDNFENEACIEITMIGFKAKALGDVAVAITGADLGLCLNSNPIKTWRCHVLKRGDVLTFTALNLGCRAYLALGGGIHLPTVLGSKSTNLSSRFGGVDGRPLRQGDILWSESPEFHLKTAGRHFDRSSVPLYKNDWLLRVVLGPQDDHFSETSLDLFLQSVFRVSPRSDRTGIRLQGPVVETKEGMAESIISEGVIAGTIQVPGDGQPIIILNETVSGGYRKIATVISADLPILGQIISGDRIRFQAVSLRAARQALWRLEETIGRFRDSLSD
jgi:biotin-dependent carboxylase-like uncharacterized protein